MINKKRRITLFLVLALSFVLLAGCSKSVESIRTETSEEAIELFNKYNVDDNVDGMISLYSNVYINSTGYSTKQMTKIMKNNREKANITKSVTKNIIDKNENLKLARVEITATINGEVKVDTYNYAIIKEERGWAVSPDGVINSVSYDVPAPKEDKLSINLSRVITTFDGTIIRCNVNNTSNNSFMFGSKDKKCEVVVETTEGVFSTYMDQEVIFNKNMQNHFMANFKDLVGDVNKVTIKSIYNLDNKGNVVLDSVQDVIVYTK